MHPMHAMIGMMNQMGENLAYNLEFIPEDKLSWKPAPTAMSAFEIVDHLTGFVRAMVPAIQGQGFQPDQKPPVSTLAEAQAAVRESTKAYAEALGKLTPEDMGKTLELPFGTYPLGMVSSFPVVDLLHHHGQIAYLQTMLGDTESHFLGM